MVAELGLREGWLCDGLAKERVEVEEGISRGEPAGAASRWSPPAAA